MNKKKIIKIVLITLLSLIIAVIAASVAVFQLVIKPNMGKIAETVETVINDPEFIEGLVIDEGLEEDINQIDLSDLVVDDKQETPVEKPKKPKSEYKSTYDYMKDNVSSGDLKKGMSFASRIDISYVLGLLKGGLTAEEKTELKAYLKERFTNEEISEGIALYKKYSYLLK